jgi:desampylase
MFVRISSESIAAIRAHAAETPGVEVCGLLFGTVEAVEHVQRCANVADTPATAFEIDPAALIAAHKAERAGGAKLIGHYHSHPNGACAPSAVDASNADVVGHYWLIVAGGEVGIWYIRVPGQFVECEVEVGAGLYLAPPAS